MVDPEYLRLIADEAHAFLRDRVGAALISQGWQDFWDPDECIRMHLTPAFQLDRLSREDVFERILLSAQNRQDAPNVILGSVKGGLETLRRLLLGFDVEKIVARWADGEALFADLVACGDVQGAMRTGSRSRWPQFCKTVVSASKFLSQFQTGADFRCWIEKYRGDVDLAIALPLVLERRIFGFGLALACDFLKEIGCDEYVKVDAWIKRLACALDLSSADNDYDLFCDLMALGPALRSISLTPYAFDKYLWLLGSGNFYRVEEDEYPGQYLNIGSQADAFLERFAKIRSERMCEAVA